MTGLLKLYEFLTRKGQPLLEQTLKKREQRQKEDPARIGERMGRPGLPRPDGALVWIHAASVGESQSTLILIDAIHARHPQAKILVTTGTVSSATLMGKRLPPFALHQYIPLDNPDWIASFLNHWKPDAALWMESELWPNFVTEIKRRGIPLALINARLSDKSVTRWRLVKNTIRTVLESFSIILTQTKNDEQNFRLLGAQNIVTTNNLKYSSAPLPFDSQQLSAIKSAIGQRPTWVYASTHDGEELLACRVHAKLKSRLPDLLTIIVPRHIDRRGAIAGLCRSAGLACSLRSEGKLPGSQDDIYIADTLGELGLFYTLSPIAMIGRSFSNDGGGGHNPVEAAQLNCAVLTGPHVQYQQQMFDDMFAENAALQVHTEQELYNTLSHLMTDGEALRQLQDKSAGFAREKSHVIDVVMTNLSSCLALLEKKNAA